jgi:phosphoribosylanthranilate isomerase
MLDGYLELKLAHELFQKAPDTLNDAEQARLGKIAGKQARLEQRILASAAAAQVVVPAPTIATRLAEIRQRYASPDDMAADLERIKSFIGVADRFLFDAKPPKGSALPGGNGVAFDWRILAGLDAGVDYMLSGGLNAANVGDALRLAGPPAIDISSGVESAPGIKDPALIEQFFRAVRAARDDRAA